MQIFPHKTHTTFTHRFGALTNLQKYGGLIELRRTPDETARDIRQRRPIQFIIHFPVQTPLPVLTMVAYDNVMLCSGSVGGGASTSTQPTRKFMQFQSRRRRRRQHRMYLLLLPHTITTCVRTFVALTTSRSAVAAVCRQSHRVPVRIRHVRPAAAGCQRRQRRTGDEYNHNACTGIRQCKAISGASHQHAGL